MSGRTLLLWSGGLGILIGSLSTPLLESPPALHGAVNDRACQICHPGPTRGLRASVHGTLIRQPETAELACTVCHGVTVVDDDVDICNPADVDWAVQTRCCYETDLLLIPDAIGHRLNPMVEDDKWTRLGIDATVPLPIPDKFIRASMENVDLSDYEITGQ